MTDRPQNNLNLKTHRPILINNGSSRQKNQLTRELDYIIEQKTLIHTYRAFHPTTMFPTIHRPFGKVDPILGHNNFQWRQRKDIISCIQSDQNTIKPKFNSKRSYSKVPGY